MRRLCYVLLYLFVLAVSLMAATAGKGQTVPPTTIPPLKNYLPITHQNQTGGVFIRSSRVVDWRGVSTVIGEIVNDTSYPVEITRIQGVICEGVSLPCHHPGYAMIQKLLPGMVSPFRIPLWSIELIISHYEVEIDWNPTDQLPQVLELSQVQPYPYGFRGRVRNQTSIDQVLPKVVLVVYNTQGDVVDANFIYLTTNLLPSGAEVSFDLSSSIQLPQWGFTYSIMAIDD